MPAPIHLQLARQIVDTLKSVCAHDINYIDLRGRICASTDPSRVDDYHRGGFEAVRQGRTVIIEKDDQESGDRRGINMPILYNGEIVAVIGITGDPEEVQRYAEMAQRITILLLREQELNLHELTGKAQVQYVLRTILREETVHPAVLQEVLASRGIPSARGDWRTVVFLPVLTAPDAAAEPDMAGQASQGPGSGAVGFSGLSALEQDLLQVFERIGKCLYLNRFPEEYVLTAPAHVIDGSVSLLTAFAERHRRYLRIGIGAAEKLQQQSHSRQTARIAAISSGGAVSPDGIDSSVVCYDDLDLEVLLASVPASDRDLYLQKALSALDEEDLRILAVYYDCGMSLQAAAQALFMHKNTLQYKLNRIHRRCGYDPRTFRDAVVLYTAVKLYGLRSGSA